MGIELLELPVVAQVGGVRLELLLPGQKGDGQNLNVGNHLSLGHIVGLDGQIPAQLPRQYVKGKIHTADLRSLWDRPRAITHKGNKEADHKHRRGQQPRRYSEQPKGR